MTPAQATIESARADAGLVTTSQAIAEMQRGKAAAVALAQSAQAAYQTWLDSDQGKAAQEHAEVMALHLAFDAGWNAGDEWSRHVREWQRQSHENHDIDL